MAIKKLNDKMGRIAKPDIKKLSKHVQERMTEHAVSLDDVNDAIYNPLDTGEIRDDGTYRIIGRIATVGVNAFDGAITTAWKTGRKDLRDLQGGDK